MPPNQRASRDNAGCSRSWPSEGQLQSELRQPRWSRREDLIEVGRVQIGHRQAKIGMIGDIARFCTKLHAHHLRKCECPCEGCIEIGKCRPACDIAARVSKLSGLGDRVQTL